MADIVFTDNPAPVGALVSTDGIPLTQDPGGTPTDRFAPLSALLTVFDPAGAANAAGSALLQILTDPIWQPPAGTGPGDDEFQGSTIDVDWIDVESDPLPAWRQRLGVLSSVIPANDPSGRLHPKLRALADLGLTPPFRIETALRSIMHSQNFPMGGLVVADGATYNAGAQFIVGYFSQDATHRRWVGTHTGFNAATSIAAEQVGSVGGMAQYLALEVGATNSVTVQVSADGVLWDTVSMHTLGFVPTHVGLFVSGWNSGLSAQVGFDHFRTPLVGPGFIAFGDSISGAYGVDTSSGWARQVINRGADLTVLRNAGISGNTVAQMAGRVAADVVAFSPAVVTVCGGINDIFTNGTAPATIETNLASIYAALEAAGIDFVACTMPPRDSYGAGTSADWAAVNTWIKAHWSDYPHGHLCDWQPALTSGTSWISGLSGDGVHPNGVGSSIMATELAPVIAAI